MVTTIQLKHPAGKKAVCMDEGKYNTLKELLINCLKTKGESTHAEILQTISENFKKNKMKFAGSIGWYLEWVKLDLEAAKVIKRVGDKSPVKFVVT